MWSAGECYTSSLTLFPDQFDLLNTAPPRLFVTGPPGTGKTVVLQIKGVSWLLDGHHVYIVSTCDESRAACIMLYHLLLQTVKTQQSVDVSPGQLHLLLYRLHRDMEKAANDLSQAASGGSLYVIADVVRSLCFKDFCAKLLTQIPRLHLWAASCFHGDAPAGWQVEYLTRPLRSPPTVVREVEQDAYITEYRLVKPYSKRGVPDHTDGPLVRRLYHRGQGHSGFTRCKCVTCGREVASILHSLRAGVTENVTTTSTTVTSTMSGTTPPCLQWSDMLVLYYDFTKNYSDMVEALKKAGIPAQVMEDDDIEDVATARSDVVWVARGFCVQGLERTVVVCLEDSICERLNLMSGCTEQLVIISSDASSPD